MPKRVSHCGGHRHDGPSFLQVVERDHWWKLRSQMSAKGQKRTCQKKREAVAAVSLRIASHAFRPVDPAFRQACTGTEGEARVDLPCAGSRPSTSSAAPLLFRP